MPTSVEFRWMLGSWRRSISVGTRAAGVVADECAAPERVGLGAPKEFPGLRAEISPPDGLGAMDTASNSPRATLLVTTKRMAYSIQTVAAPVSLRTFAAESPIPRPSIGTHRAGLIGESTSTRIKTAISKRLTGGQSTSFTPVDSERSVRFTVKGGETHTPFHRSTWKKQEVDRLAMPYAPS